jgi:EAL domain
MKGVATSSRRRRVVPSGLFLMAQPIMSLTAPTQSLNFEICCVCEGWMERSFPLARLSRQLKKRATLPRATHWVSESILEWIEAHRNSLVNTRFICVNLSGGSLNDGRFAEEIFEIFARHRPVLHYLCLEITYSVALHDRANTQRFLARLHEMGVRTALDDLALVVRFSTPFRRMSHPAPNPEIRRLLQLPARAGPQISRFRPAFAESIRSSLKRTFALVATVRKAIAISGAIFFRIPKLSLQTRLSKFSRLCISLHLRS